jgi:GNAT superfamily N-acetyltransferase
MDDTALTDGISVAPALAEDARFGCGLIFDNMNPYYERYGMRWDRSQVEAVWGKTDNHLLRWRGHAVGVLCLQHEPDVLSIRTLQLAAPARGRGLGGAALAFAEGLARTRGLQRLSLAVFLDNPARELYRRVGFRELRHEGVVVWCEKALA